MPPRRVTVIDDSPEVLELFEDALGLRGLEVEVLEGCATVTQIEASTSRFSRRGPAARDGEPARIGHRATRPGHPPLRSLPIIVCSAALDQLRGHEDEFTRIPHLYPLPKPFSLADLDSCLHGALA